MTPPTPAALPLLARAAVERLDLLIAARAAAAELRMAQGGPETGHGASRESSPSQSLVGHECDDAAGRAQTVVR